MAIWTLSKMRQEVRDITGRKSEGQMTSAKIDEYLNEYYTLVLPRDLDLEEIQGFWTKNTAAGNDTVALDAEVLCLLPPMTVGGYPVELVDDPVRFYALYPKFGEPYTQNRPEIVMQYGRDLIMRPAPDAIYQIHAPSLEIPSAIAGESGAPLQDAWGRLICLGTAILIYGSFGQRESVEKLSPAYETQKALVQRPFLKRMQTYRGQPRF